MENQAYLILFCTCFAALAFAGLIFSIWVAYGAWIKPPAVSVDPSVDQLPDAWHVRWFLQTVRERWYWRIFSIISIAISLTILAGYGVFISQFFQ